MRHAQENIQGNAPTETNTDAKDILKFSQNSIIMPKLNPKLTNASIESGMDKKSDSSNECNADTKTRLQFLPNLT